MKLSTGRITLKSGVVIEYQEHQSRNGKLEPITDPDKVFMTLDDAIELTDELRKKEKTLMLMRLKYASMHLADLSLRDESDAL